MAVVVIDMERISSGKSGAHLMPKFEGQQQSGNQEIDQHEQESSLLNEIIVATTQNSNNLSNHTSEAIDFRLCSPPLGKIDLSIR